MAPRVKSSSPMASRRMARVRQKGTGAEIALRRELYRSGLRFRVSYEVLKKPRRVADIAIPRFRIAVFVDGCFWHGCPEHATWPKQNSEFWRQKLEANRTRDADTNARLNLIGWTVLRFWEHESPIRATEAILKVISKITAKVPQSQGARVGLTKAAPVQGQD